MSKKQLHIVTVGNSIITNYQNKFGMETGIKNAREGDKIWDELVQDKSFLNKVFEFVMSAPKENSAEINAFERFLEKTGVKHFSCSLYLCGTNTASNEIAKSALERYLKEKGCEVFNQKEVSGYFWESNFSEEIACEEFTKGISELLDTFLRIATKKKEEGYEVVFNPTGGMKPHVIVCALAGFMTASPVYYIHENFKDLVILPPLLYLPRGKEISVLRELNQHKYLSRTDSKYEKFKSEKGEEIERLKLYGIIEVETDEKTGKEYRIRLTSKGKFIAGLYHGT